MRLLPFWKSNEMQPASDLTGRLDGLSSEVGKLGREQFRVTTLLEGYGASLDELSEAWREYLAERDRDSVQRALDQLEDQVRLRLAKDLLPVADALHTSIVAAPDMRAEVRQAKPTGLPLLMQRLLAAPAATAAEPNAAFDSWLEGLVLVEKRLLALLEREGIRPIPTLGQPFDPHRHIAVAVRDEHGVADGSVVAEELRGYTFGDRVLRHAEVVIARKEPQIDAHGRVTHGEDRRD